MLRHITLLVSSARQYSYFYCVSRVGKGLQTPKFILLSRSTAFQMKYLQEMSVDMKLGRSFVDVSERFNGLNGTKSFCH